MSATATVSKKKRIVKFAPKGEQKFYELVKARVDEYFQSNNITENGNRKMYIKTAVMLSMYFVPYVFIVTGLGATNMFLFYGLYLLMGLGIVGIGTSVMHDSNHGSYTTSKNLNHFIAGILNVLGGYSPNWRIQHNILHHTYTNLDGLDEDIEPSPILRLSPHKPLWKMHRYQHIYAWVLYSLMNLFWVIVKDYRLIFRYNSNGLLQKEKLTLTRALTELSLLKVFYVGYMIVVPIMFAGVAWYHVVFGILVMHMVAGLSLACIFQPAHVMETSEYPLPSGEQKMDNSWAVHQMLNTTNFAREHKLISWFIGGLNFQIEHHLFPQVCHVHYPEIALIVKRTAEECDIPYIEQYTFMGALRKHGKMLKLLGHGRWVAPAIRTM